MSGLEVRHGTQPFVTPQTVSRTLLPGESPLAMPRQSFTTRRAVGRTPATSPKNVGLRRLTLLAATLCLATLAGWAPFAIYAKKGFTGAEIAALGLFAILITSIACWFSSAFLGFCVRLARGDRDELNFPAQAPRPTTRTALLMPVYNEDPRGVFERLARIEADLTAHGAEQAFDIFVLSDTTKDPIALEEWSSFLAFRARSSCRAYYRRRAENHERKAGNVAEWVQRFGGAYESMIIFDADSVMTADTLLQLVGAMERNPQAGLIQTTPAIIEGDSLFARASQFGVRLYGRVAATGLAWWSGSEASYWGHNAILRVRAFAECAGLPILKGPRPFGGHVMSHDVIEASLMRRGGWGVHVTAALGGSFEQTPPSLAEFMARDRRWCQGNLQHIPLIFAPGLHPVSRLQLFFGVLAYLASPLWLASLVVGMGIQLYATLGVRALPTWQTMHAHHPMTAMVFISMVSMVLLMGPKMLGAALVLANKQERALFGGGRMVLKGALLEMALSATIAPIMMVAHTRIIFEALSGRDSGWSTSARDSHDISWRDAAMAHRWELVVGVVFAACLCLRPDLIAWFTPIVLPLLLSTPISVFVSRSAPGIRARNAGYMLTPEERGVVALPPLPTVEDNLVPFVRVAAEEPVPSSPEPAELRQAIAV
ncbi:membrane glycosyltransferase [Caulobacter ginsengisoli]|uniref:Glucans biosynthesis glucosyltransferase H n=1 Tax=Caulobacter ginsengisoli TaxID=400775 RepID=A0ABU0ISU0_9CAUL|nr:glucans biosynthesis glucosyltransferase MdoH [Caulobacter ginsengisoli]MDQ0465072.1 membrane glycosyltransferase [Caulobacter ginsengisoli]